MQNENVYFEIRNILLRIKEYKKNNQTPLSPQFCTIFKKVLANDYDYDIVDIVQQLIDLEENDEFIQIALVYFFSKLFTCCLENSEWLTEDITLKILNHIEKNEVQIPVYYEKRLKVIRNGFELPISKLTKNIVQKLWNILKMTEQTQSNLLIKELSRDILSQSIKRFLYSNWRHQENDEILIYLLEQLIQDVEQYVDLYLQDPVKHSEQIRLIEYPLSIFQFLLKLYTKQPDQKRVKEFIQQKLLFQIIRLSQIDNTVIINLTLDFCSKFQHMLYQGILEDTYETRTILGQLVLKQFKNQIKKLSSFNLIDLGAVFMGELDVSIIIKFLQKFFNNHSLVIYTYKKSDLNFLQNPLFEEIIQSIFELSRISKKLVSEEAKLLQKQVEDLIFILFQCSQSSKQKGKICQEQKQKFMDFLVIFNDEEQGPRAAFKKYCAGKQESSVCLLKHCNRLKDTFLIQILGYHKQECIEIMESYIKSFKMKGFSVEEALRLLLANFLLFGESQMIERFLNQFSIFYCSQESSIFANSDNLFTYTYALLMLNTDLYNKTNKNRMSLEEFVNNTKKVNYPDLIPEDYLKMAYENIRKDEIKCARDFALTDHLSQFIWVQASKNREQIEAETKLAFELFPGLFDPGMAESQLSELIMSQMTQNIEQMITKYQSSPEELTDFLQHILQICIKNDQLDNAHSILDSMYNYVFPKEDLKQQPSSTTKSPNKSPVQSSRSLNSIIDSSLHQHLYTCFYIAKELLPYEQNPQLIVDLIANTSRFRHVMSTDEVSRDCRKILIKIKTNEKFNKKNLGSNRGIINLFSSFLVEEDLSDDDQTLKEMPKTVRVEQVGIRSERLVSDIIVQTKYLEENSLNQFVNLLLEKIKDSSDIEYAQLIYIVVEVLRVNSDRMSHFWPDVTKLLGVSKKKRYLESYSKYIQMKLTIEFLHFEQELQDYNQCFEQGLQYLENQSLEILVDFLHELRLYVQTNKLDECGLDTISKTYQILKKIYEILQNRSLDKNDAKVIFELTQESYENLIQKNYLMADTFLILEQQLDFLNVLLKQKEMIKVQAVDSFIAKNTISIVDNYEVYIEHKALPEEKKNKFLLSIFNLAVVLSKDHSLKVIQIIQKITLNLDYKIINEADFRYIFTKITQFQPIILTSKSEANINNYTQIIQRIFFNWVTPSNCHMKLWMDVLHAQCQVIQHCKVNKMDGIVEVLQLRLRSVYWNMHFQKIIDGIAKQYNTTILEQGNANEIKEKTRQIFANYQLEYQEAKLEEEKGDTEHIS